MVKSNNAIMMNNLTKYYGKSRGIIDLNLSVEKGECFGFVGPNGAGKSTTIRTLLGLISPSSGTASIFGKDIVKDHDEILKEIGYLPSEAIFYAGMKAIDIFKLSMNLRKMDCMNEAKNLCERLQLDMSKKVDELSFGDRKKVAIVCALQSQPSLLIMDEPTGGLDPLMQREFFHILNERRNEGATIFLSSHILSEVQRNCNRAAVIREGRIIASGSVEDLAKTSAKRVSITGHVNLEGLEGLKDIAESNNAVSFLYNGDMSLLLNRLQEGKISDLTISEPDLEEIFLHYYEGDESL